MSKYKAILFDLDGTLVSTNISLIHHLFNQAVSKFGKTASVEDCKRFWFFNGRTDFIKNHFGISPSDFWPVYGALDTVDLRKKHAKAYPDVSSLHQLKSQGFKLGIVTGAKDDIAEYEIGLVGRALFDSVIVAHPNLGVAFKPHPQGIENCLKMLGFSNNQAVYIGNADEDVVFAKNAGVLDILVDRGEYVYSGPEPSHKISHLYELENFLR